MTTTTTPATAQSPTAVLRRPVALPPEWGRTPLTVVMPTYNEAENLPLMAEALMGLDMPGLRLLVVDDNSPDGTGEVAERLAERYNTGGRTRVSVLHRTAKDGLGRAYAAGMDQAVADGAAYVLQMDADGSHPVEYVPQMLGSALSTGAGFVIGSRYVSGGRLAEEWGWHRKLLSRWANAYVSAVLRTGLRDVTAGFCMWRADTVTAMRLPEVRSNGYSFQVELKYQAVRAGCTGVEIPIHFEERQIGASKMTLAVQLESAILPWRLRMAGKRR
ncbi:polyprenol monophosphomannose synthase [Streptantibioticus parmotrematis]|uniref:polyprenol monophosphomannose synthase n=1 Tax=Streptantibioticus parmotrematis TaxID=2873249 RepID=UPI0033E848F6